MTDPQQLTEILKQRFEENTQRHEGLIWEPISKRLQQSPQKIQSLLAMEASGGEPDVIGYEESSEQYLFVDCAAESPKARRSCCYDQAALEARKKYKPNFSALARAEEMGVDLLSERQYFQLQSLGEFDLKTSSWLKTPVEVRELGGAIFGDRRYNRVFIYHNGAESYYASRGFRTSLLL